MNCPTDLRLNVSVFLEYNAASQPSDGSKAAASKKNIVFSDRCRWREAFERLLKSRLTEKFAI